MLEHVNHANFNVASVVALYNFSYVFLSLFIYFFVYLTKYSSRLVRTIMDFNIIRKDKDQK